VAILQTPGVPYGASGWNDEVVADLIAINADAANAIATAGAALNAAQAATALIPYKTVSATTYTLLLTDLGLTLLFTNAAGCTVTIPANASVPFPLGWNVELAQVNAGAVTVGVGTGIFTPIKRMGTLVSGGVGAVLNLANWGTDLWWLTGPTTA
jgi:hypothetical protein